MPGRVEEADIGNIQFTETDGIFIFIGAQADYIRSAAGASIENTTFFSMSLNALAQVLRGTQAAIVSHEDFATDPEVREIRDLAGRHDRSWLSSLGCAFGVLGLDFARIDALCQYYFFRYVLYIDLVARRMIEANPRIERFYVIRGPEPLPLDFDFDSDLGQAVVRHVCEQLGRPVVEIVSAEHQISNGPDFLARPFSKGWVTPMVTGMPFPDEPHHHVGLITSTVPVSLRIIHDAKSLNCAKIVFHCPWPVSFPRVTTDQQEEARRTDADRAWAEGMAGHLANLRIVIGQRLERSRLPPAIAGNPHLGFQWDHIVTKRWLMLATLTRFASAFAQVRPLDIFINPEMANWEGMVLAELYRRQGSKILVAPHSGWPGQAFDASWQPGDWAMVYARSGKARLHEISGLDKIYTIGMPWVAPARAPEWEAMLAEKRRILNGRKLVIHIPSPMEVSFIPLLDQKAHFASVAEFGRIPAHLKDQVMIAVRRRGPHGCEADSIYRELSGLDDEALHFLDGLTFHDCVELADCLVAINVPTSGYYEVFQGGKPLIHLKSADVIYMQPDLPPDVIGQVDRDEDLWPSIEAVLFDEGRRQSLLDIQARFLEEDLRPDFPADQSPIRSLLDLMLTQD